MNDAPEPEIARTQATDVPAIIHLPDQTQPPPKKRRGKHFGPRPVKDRRSERIDLRVTKAQLAAIKEAAREAGNLSVSALIVRRTIGDEGPRARRQSAPDLALLAKVLGLLGKSGSNLNQIARRMNEYDFDGIPELLAMRTEHEETLAEHRAIYDAILKALGV